MRIILFIVFLLSFASASAQNKLSLNLVYRPEITTYKDNISFRWKEKTPKHTLSAIGFRVMPEYHFTPSLFVRAGVGFINRSFKNNVFFNQTIAAGDSTKPLYLSEKTSYRIIEFPLAVGYSIFQKQQWDIDVLGEISSNYLLNAHYKPPMHAGTYKKHYWLGHSGLGSIRAKYKMKNNIALTLETGYVFKNETKKDSFLFSQDEPVIAIEHRYIPVLLGLNYSFR